MLGFNDTSTLVGHFVSSPKEREKRDRMLYVGVGSIELINLHSSLKTPRHMYINIQKRHFSIPSIWLVARLKRKTMTKEK